MCCKIFEKVKNITVFLFLKLHILDKFWTLKFAMVLKGLPTYIQGVNTRKTNFEPKTVLGLLHMISLNLKEIPGLFIV